MRPAGEKTPRLSAETTVTLYYYLMRTVLSVLAEIVLPTCVPDVGTCFPRPAEGLFRPSCGRLPHHPRSRHKPRPRHRETHESPRRPEVLLREPNSAVTTRYGRSSQHQDESVTRNSFNLAPRVAKAPGRLKFLIHIKKVRAPLCFHNGAEFDC